MEGLENFAGFDSGEGVSEEAFERFKERMKGAAKDLKAWQKGEQKQKKREDELIKILLKYIKAHKKSSFTLLVSRMLEENIPASFVLGIILLGDEAIQSEMGIKIALPPASEGTSTAQSPAPGQSLLAVFGIEDATLPLKAKAEFDFWIKNLIDQASVHPHKIISTLEEKNEKGEPAGAPKLIAIQLQSFVLREFLNHFKIDYEFEKIQDFAKFVLISIIQQMHKQADDQNLLGDR